MRVETQSVHPKTRTIPDIQKVPKAKRERYKHLIFPISISTIGILLLYKHFYLKKDN